MSSLQPCELLADVPELAALLVAERRGPRGCGRHHPAVRVVQPGLPRRGLVHRAEDRGLGPALRRLQEWPHQPKLVLTILTLIA